MAKHYLILQSDSVDELMVMVNQHIDFHYNPIGGMVTDSAFNFYQTMLRDTPGGKYAKDEHEAHLAIEEDLAEDDE